MEQISSKIIHINREVDQTLDKKRDAFKELKSKTIEIGTRELKKNEGLDYPTFRSEIKVKDLAIESGFSELEFELIKEVIRANMPVFFNTAYHSLYKY